MTPERLRDKPIRKAIEVSAKGYCVKVEPYIRDLSTSKQQALRQDLNIFAGFKTYHHLSEVSQHARKEDGSLKTWQEFNVETAKIDDKYNKNWLKAEYDFVQASAQMAQKWERFAQWGDAYDLLYKTAGDEKVRANHAQLEGMCLPFSDPAWDVCYPPNGWGCRCDVIQVIPGSHPRSSSDEMIKSLEEMTERKQEIFRFNAGKQGRLTPPKHPYYGKKGYDHCTTKQGKLAGKLEPDEECEILRNLLDAKNERKALIKECKEKFAGKYVSVKNAPEPILITSSSIEEYINQPFEFMQEKNQKAINLESFISESRWLGRLRTRDKDLAKGRISFASEVKINGHEYYLIFVQHRGTPIKFYSISDGDIPQHLE